MTITSLTSPAYDPYAVAVDPGELTASDRRVLHALYEGAYGDPWAVYSDPSRRTPSRPQMRALASLGLVTFLDGKDAGWAKDMWGAWLTCLGANTVFRSGPGEFGSHPGCGQWRVDGTCTGCRSRRPLDADAYAAYLRALGTVEREHQESGPRLFCVEHGWVRRDEITTQKVCRLRGSNKHDPSLIRA